MILLICVFVIIRNGDQIMKRLFSLLIMLMFLATSMPNTGFILPVYANEGGGEGENPELTKTITLNKKLYSAQDMEDAAKSVYADKDTVIIEGTSDFSGKGNSYSHIFISLARYLPELAAELLNKWLHTETYVQKNKLLIKTMKRTFKLAEIAAKYGSKIQQVKINRALFVLAELQTNSLIDRDKQEKR